MEQPSQKVEVNKMFSFALYYLSLFLKYTKMV